MAFQVPGTCTLAVVISFFLFLINKVVWKLLKKLCESYQNSFTFPQSTSSVSFEQGVNISNLLNFSDKICSQLSLSTPPKKKNSGTFLSHPKESKSTYMNVLSTQRPLAMTQEFWLFILTFTWDHQASLFWQTILRVIGGRILYWGRTEAWNFAYALDQPAIGLSSLANVSALTSGLIRFWSLQL